MARPVNPKAVRRTVEGAPVEVLTAAGVWIEWQYLTVTSQTNVYAALVNNGHSSDFPAGEFNIKFGDTPPTQQQRVQPDNNKYDIETDDDDDDWGDADPTDDDADGDDDADDDADADDDSQEQQQQQQEQQQPEPKKENKSPMEMMMEDIVRNIAAELDTEQQVGIDANFASMQSWIDDRLANLPTTPVSPDGPQFVPVVTRVEIVTPTVTIAKDGLFHQSFSDLVANCIAGIHTYLPGPPGTGKSHSTEQAAHQLGWMHGATSLGPTTPESRLWGGMDANGRFIETRLLECIRHAQDNPESGAIYCLDEMDNGHSGILATLNSALANGWVFAPNGDRLTLGPNMVFVAAANTYGTGPTAEFAGRNKLDPATLDRFSYIPWDTDVAMESALVSRWLAPDTAVAWLDAWRTLRANVESHGLKFFVTMRGAINGAKIIAHGRSVDKAMMLVAGNKLPADQWRKVSPL